jgi:hypothetical protein
VPSYGTKPVIRSWEFPTFGGSHTNFIGSIEPTRARNGQK